MLHVEILIARSEAQRDAALAYIEREMRRRFKCKPPPTHGIIFVAKMEREIVGTVVYETADENNVFSLEDRYAFGMDAASYLCERTKMVQGTRWIATRQG